jgi:hypothetical protein
MIATDPQTEFLQSVARAARRQSAAAIAEQLHRIADNIEVRGLTRDDIVAAGYAAGHCELHLQPAAFFRVTAGCAVRQSDVFLECDLDGVLVVTVTGEPT